MCRYHFNHGIAGHTTCKRQLNCAQFLRHLSLISVFSTFFTSSPREMPAQKDRFIVPQEAHRCARRRKCKVTIESSVALVLLIFLGNRCCVGPTQDIYYGCVSTVPGTEYSCCLLYTSPSPRDQRGSRMPSSA